MAAVIGVIASSVIFVSGILWAGGTMLMFWDLASVIIVFGFDAGALAVSGGFGPFGLGIKTVFTGKTDAEQHELLAAADSFDLMARCSIGGGLIGLVMALVMLLVTMDAVDVKVHAPYLGVAILTVLYGLMLAYLFFYPGKAKLLRLARR